MKWIKENRREIVFWLILLAVAPLFVEILFVANIMGAEVAVGFLALVFLDIKNRWVASIHEAKEIFKSILAIIQNHPIAQANVYTFHVTASFAVLFLTGTATYAVLVWYPIVTLGGYA